MICRRIRVIDCPKDFDISLDVCKACNDCVKIVENYVECSYGDKVCKIDTSEIIVRDDIMKFAVLMEIEMQQFPGSDIPIMSIYRHLTGEITELRKEIITSNDIGIIQSCGKIANYAMRITNKMVKK